MTLLITNKSNAVDLFDLIMIQFMKDRRSDWIHCDIQDIIRLHIHSHLLSVPQLDLMDTHSGGWIQYRQAGLRLTEKNCLKRILSLQLWVLYNWKRKITVTCIHQVLVITLISQPYICLPDFWIAPQISEIFSDIQYGYQSPQDCTTRNCTKLNERLLQMHRYLCTHSYQVYPTNYYFIVEILSLSLNP